MYVYLEFKDLLLLGFECTNRKVTVAGFLCSLVKSTWLVF
jgi:hypothetical protein